MKSLLRQLSIKAKLNLILALSVCALIIVQAISLNELWHDLNETKKGELKQITEVAYSVINAQHKRAEKGEITLEQAQDNAKTLIAELTYGQNEYFFILDKSHTMVMHPIKPALNGSDVSAMADANGTLFFNTMINNAVNNGESFTGYVWPRPGEKESVDKLSYTKYFSNWAWLVGTGVYIDDLKTKFHHEIWVASRSTLMVLIVMFFVVYFTSASILGPILSLESKMNRVAADNDLTIRSKLSGKDELADMGRAFNTMITSFHDILGNMNLAAEQISCASTQLSGTTEQTLIGMENQKAETHQVASAMTEMSATVHEVATNISEAANASHVAAQASETGKNVVLASRKLIEQLSSKLQDAEVLIHKLEDESNNISSILSVITGIAEQTNLLALNAAIEAARAGEQGRGFAVVADEVRSLSSRTHESTNEIHNVITSLQAGSQAAVRAMSESKEAAQLVVNQATHTENALTDITNSVSQIDIMTSQIASASEEQTVVAEEINRNINNISQISEESAIGANQTALATKELAKLAIDLKEIVQQFKIQA